jgi:hypothetical protein
MSRIQGDGNFFYVGASGLIGYVFAVIDDGFLGEGHAGAIAHV